LYYCGLVDGVCKTAGNGMLLMVACQQSRQDWQVIAVGETLVAAAGVD
jgi:hypothetical protein